VHDAREGRAPTRPDWENLPCVNDTAGEAESLRCEAVALDLDHDELLVVIPPVITPIMEGDPDLALDWRLKTRRIFQAYFDRGYRVDGFYRAERRALYRLTR
jgi:predicted GNAT superfamily acetyltransferase